MTLLVPPDTDGHKIVCAADRAQRPADRRARVDQRLSARSSCCSSQGDDAQTPQIGVSISGFSRPVLHFTIKPRDDEPTSTSTSATSSRKAPTKVFSEPGSRRHAPLRQARHALGAALSTIRRTAEAAALRFLLTEQMKGNDTPVIVLGDINDGQHSNTANILTEQPRYLVGDSVGGGDVALYTAQTLQEYRDTRDVYYTHVYQDLRESLDHILVSDSSTTTATSASGCSTAWRSTTTTSTSTTTRQDGTNDHGIIRAVFKHKPVRDGA